MSVTVKVQLGEKLFKLSQGITSLEQIDEEMNRRYPKKLPMLEYLFEGVVIQELEPLLIAQQKKGKTSIKIEARQSSDFSRNDISIISIASTLKEEKSISAMEVEKAIELPVIQYLMPKQFYVCFNCAGMRVYRQEGINILCEVCKGRGELNNDHRYVERVRQLFEKHVKPVLKIQEIKKQEFSRLFRGLNKVYELNIAETNRIERMEIGQNFTYQFQIHNLGKDLPEELEVVNCESKESTKVKTLKSGEKITIQLGPFKCESEALLEQAFYLCYRKEDGWERLGYRFGFRVRGFKKSEVKKLESTSRELIRNLKMISGSRKSEEYLQMKLKSMDIDLNNMEIDDEILIQIIQQIK